jgi:hypothetical protein
MSSEYIQNILIAIQNMEKDDCWTLRNVFSRAPITEHSLDVPSMNDLELKVLAWIYIWKEIPDYPNSHLIYDSLIRSIKSDLEHINASVSEDIYQLLYRLITHFYPINISKVARSPRVDMYNNATYLNQEMIASLFGKYLRNLVRIEQPNLVMIFDWLKITDRIDDPECRLEELFNRVPELCMLYAWAPSEESSDTESNELIPQVLVRKDRNQFSLFYQDKRVNIAPYHSKVIAYLYVARNRWSGIADMAQFLGVRGEEISIIIQGLKKKFALLDLPFEPLLNNRSARSYQLSGMKEEARTASGISVLKSGSKLILFYNGKELLLSPNKSKLLRMCLEQFLISGGAAPIEIPIPEIVKALDMNSANALAVLINSLRTDLTTLDLPENSVIIRGDRNHTVVFDSGFNFDVKW